MQPLCHVNVVRESCADFSCVGGLDEDPNQNRHGGSVCDSGHALIT